METKLAENIRALRKQRNLTQEQLAETLGVTVGAVHKWETRLSTPDLGLIMEMADFFDVSVDMLLGYEMKDNRLEATVKRLGAYERLYQNPDALSEAEKALKRFPHSFPVVYSSAMLFLMVGGKSRDQRLLARSSELLKEALLLLPQNTDPRVSATGIYRHMADALILRGQGAQAAELLEAHNGEGVFSDEIGLSLSLFCKQPEAAQPYLSDALLNAIATLFKTVCGAACAFILRGDPASAKSMLQWGLDTLNGLRLPGRASYIDRMSCILRVLTAYAALKTDDPGEAKRAMRQALEAAARFDAAPDYSVASLRFVTGIENSFFDDAFGYTAADSMAYIVRQLDDGALTALWKEENEDAQ